MRDVLTCAAGISRTSRRIAGRGENAVEAHRAARRQQQPQLGSGDNQSNQIHVIL